MLDYDEKQYMQQMGASFDSVDADSDGVVLTEALQYPQLGWNKALATEVFGKEENFQNMADPDDLGTINRASFIKLMASESEEAECLVFPCVLGSIFCCRLERFEEAFRLLEAHHNTAKFWPLLARTCASSQLLRLCNNENENEKSTLANGIMGDGGNESAIADTTQNAKANQLTDEVKRLQVNQKHIFFMWPPKHTPKQTRLNIYALYKTYIHIRILTYIHRPY